MGCGLPGGDALSQVSTLSAAQSGDLEGAEGFTTEEDQELIHRIEKQLKKRFAIGSQISQHTILNDFAKQKYPERQVGFVKNPVWICFHCFVCRCRRCWPR